MNSNRDRGYTAKCSPNPFLTPIHFCMSAQGRSVFSQNLVGAVFLSHGCACDHLGYRTSTAGCLHFRIFSISHVGVADLGTTL